VLQFSARLDCDWFASGQFTLTGQVMQ